MIRRLLLKPCEIPLCIWTLFPIPQRQWLQLPADLSLGGVVRESFACNVIHASYAVIMRVGKGRATSAVTTASSRRPCAGELLP